MVSPMPLVWHAGNRSFWCSKNDVTMPANIATTEDLQRLKDELLRELRQLIQPATNTTTAEGRQWLKSYEVRQLLGISASTLQTMRLNGTISYTKVGGLLFYSYADILKLMTPRQVARAGQQQRFAERRLQLLRSR